MTNQVQEDKIKQILDDYEKNKTKYIKGTTIIVFSSLSILYIIYHYFPSFSEEEKIYLKIPQNSHDLHILINILSSYVKQSPLFFILTHIYCYVLMQCFSIPGHGLLAMIAGSIWGLKIGLPLICFANTLGSTFSYFLSYTLFKGFIVKHFTKKIALFNEKIKKHEKNLFYYCMFLRISPLIPNMLVNVASPIAGVPLNIYILTTFLGILPMNFIQVSTGTTLVEVSKTGLDGKNLLILIGLSFLSLIPTFLNKKSKQKTN